MANKALKEAARELERREALTRQDHEVQRGGLAAEAQVGRASRGGSVAQGIWLMVHGGAGNGAVAPS